MSKKEEGAIEVQKTYSDIFALAADIQPGDVTLRPNCKLCNSPHRADAENYWEEKKYNTAAVVRLLQDRGESITFKAVDNHLEKHFAPAQRLLKVKDYVDNLRAYASIKNDRLADLKFFKAVLKREIAEVGAEGPALPLMERRKNDEVLAKMISQYIAVDDAEQKFNEEWKPARIIVEKLQQIVNVELVSAPESAKPLLAKVVDTLFDQVEGVK